LLPLDFRKTLNNQLLNKQYLYGCGRIVIVDPDKYVNYMRVCDREFFNRSLEKGYRKGYGYFQLFNVNSNRIVDIDNAYPVTSQNASLSDIKFSSN